MMRRELYGTAVFHARVKMGGNWEGCDTLEIGPKICPILSFEMFLL
jgi:hypothetical protein